MNALFVVTQFGAAEASGPAALGISLQAFLIQLVTFLIVFLALRQWAFKPIIKMLNDRRDIIEGGVSLGEKMRAQEAEAEAAAAAKLHIARRQADSILADADTESRQKIQAAEETARVRADAMIKEAEAQIKQASDRERKRLEKEVVELVSEVSEAVIQEKVDAKKDALLIDKAMKEHQAA
jgi:F-type H+-transporting ATPase subunit b